MLGSGEPIVLLHGYLSDSTYWKPLLPYLSSRYTVIMIDLLGFGRSPKPRTASYSLDEHVAAVERTLDSLSLSHAVFAGHSMGAIVAAAFARKNPTYVQKLYLFNMPIYTSEQQARQEMLATNVLYRTFLFSKSEQPLLLASKALVPAFGSKKLRAVYSRRHSYASRSRSMTNTILATNTLGLLQDLTVPTTLVEGKHDRKVYETNLRTITLPKAVSVIWAPTGHHTLHSKKVKPEEYFA